MSKTLEVGIHLTIDLESEELVGTLQLEPRELPLDDSEKEHEKLYCSWQEIKEYVRMETGMNKVAFATWVKPLKIVEIDGSIVYLKHPQVTLREYIETKYFVHLMAATIDILDKAYCFRFEKSED